MKGVVPCAGCERTLDVWGNTLTENPPAYSEDVIRDDDARSGVRTLYFCRECTLAAYAFCENVWITYPPAEQSASVA